MTVLVGNGERLRGAGLGAVIDAAERVVRFNEFLILGWENDVGTRTDCHYLNTAHISRGMRPLADEWWAVTNPWRLPPGEVEGGVL